MLSNLLHKTKKVIINSGYILRDTYLIYYLSLLSVPPGVSKLFFRGGRGCKGERGEQQARNYLVRKVKLNPNTTA